MDARRLTAAGYQSYKNDDLTFTPLMTGDSVGYTTFPDQDGALTPLWPETEASWKSENLLSQPWLLVDSKQQWFVELCVRAKLSSQRDCARFATYIKCGWLSSMEVEQRIASMVPSCRATSHTSRCNQYLSPPMITIAVDGFRVTCLKYNKELAVLLDTDALYFIPGYLYAQALKFKTSPPPGLGGRNVCWNKHEARWDVYLTTGEQLSGPCVDGLSVDQSLPYKEFQAQKMSSHRKAVDLWNDKDATRRAAAVWLRTNDVSAWERQQRGTTLKRKLANDARWLALNMRMESKQDGFDKDKDGTKSQVVGQEDSNRNSPQLVGM